MQEAINPAISQAIDKAVAASRWRAIAKHETGTEAVRYLRKADRASAAATVLLSEIGEDAATAIASRRVPTPGPGGALKPGE